MKRGTQVRMSEELKREFRGNCGEAGRHMGPFDPDDASDCWGCSSAHVEEFGECIGIVDGLIDCGTSKGPEVDVKWQPSGLRYAYHPDKLDRV